jgi:hypothetical protein
MYLLIIPAFIFYEGRYLIRHPWTFNWTATIVWATITAIGFIFVREGPILGIVPVIHCVAIMAYYYLKINLNRRRPRVMELHRKHYRSRAHSSHKHR